jgi:hypothetical protein
MSHELPSNLTRIDEVSTELLFQYELWLQDGYSYETDGRSVSREIARHRALLQIASQWLADLKKQGKQLVVASQPYYSYDEGDGHQYHAWPWETTEVASARALFGFAEQMYANDGFDGYCITVRCFIVSAK